MGKTVPLVSYSNDGKRTVIGTARIEANAGLALVAEVNIDPRTPMNQYLTNQLASISIAEEE
jgi:hypothetical protein